MLILQQRIYLIQCYGTGEECYRVVINKCNEKYPEVSNSNVGAKKLVTKFLETGSVLDIKKSNKRLNEDDAGASVLALHSVREAPRLLLRRRAIETEIRRDRPILWPPRSPDLTILDFHLWGRLKQIVYREPLENDEEQLKTRIQNAVKSFSAVIIRMCGTLGSISQDRFGTSTPEIPCPLKQGTVICDRKL
ncbi:hypothetical protein NQ318_006285 [Aromia moschata]|uniref:DUF4817 domain-containing protein n=1 Tax=Aromia moschata TaxID=1265417 RepID=A0AAV8YVE1_9CUCU|nr:hypothetical protein NQ318_006285 [Aromia moschata]